MHTQALRQNVPVLYTYLKNSQNFLNEQLRDPEYG